MSYRGTTTNKKKQDIVGRSAHQGRYMSAGLEEMAADAAVPDTWYLTRGAWAVSCSYFTDLVDAACMHTAYAYLSRDGCMHRSFTSATRVPGSSEFHMVRKPSPEQSQLDLLAQSREYGTQRLAEALLLRPFHQPCTLQSRISTPLYADSTTGCGPLVASR